MSYMCSGSRRATRGQKIIKFSKCGAYQDMRLTKLFFFLCCIIQLCICYHFFNLVFLTHSDTGDVCCFICFVLHFCKRATPGIDSNTLNPLSFMKLKKGHSLTMKVKDGKINLHKIFYTDWFLSITVNANKQYYITSNIL